MSVDGLTRPTAASVPPVDEASPDTRETASASPAPAPAKPPVATARAVAQKASTVLGWFAGASLGLMASVGLGAWLGSAYPMVIGNFAGVVLGAFGGMGLADRWGERSLKPLAFLTGVLMLVALMLTLTVMGSPEP
mgnify:CR=1 FL=1